MENIDLEKLNFCQVIPIIKKKNNKCNYGDCFREASYNVEGETKRLYCSTHKTDDMVNVKHKKCLDCHMLAIYNTEEEKTALYCDNHKKDGMVNVIHTLCLDCKTRATFNIEGKTKPLYCDEHKKDNMINITEKRKCLECKLRPNFNIEGETNGIYCDKHKKEGMVNVVNKKCLECKSRPSQNFYGETAAIYCDIHKKDGMINVINKTCKTHLCPTQVRNDKYDGYCLRCFIHLFPDKPVVRNYKTKEQATVDFIKQQFPDKTWITDKTITGGCSKRRPDLLMDYGEHIIIIEIDENQHKSYDDCYNRRMMEISQDLGHRPVVFIRFNPDDYIDKNNTKIKSCWSITKQTGLVKIDNKKIWEQRLNVLKNHVQYWINNKTKKTVENIHLFYDETL